VKPWVQDPLAQPAFFLLMSMLWLITTHSVVLQIISINSLYTISLHLKFSSFTAKRCVKLEMLLWTNLTFIKLFYLTNLLKSVFCRLSLSKYKITILEENCNKLSYGNVLLCWYFYPGFSVCVLYTIVYPFNFSHYPFCSLQNKTNPSV